jgi:antitoxin (DNA-binding transcriptional repressor) of toxin-antitoxin stability system
MYSLLMTSISVSEARATLPEMLDRVLAGEEVTITRHGKPVAVMLRPDAVRARRADQAFAEADRIGDLLREGRSTPLSDGPHLSRRRADELVAEVAADRAAR